jgi:hypothetical protein
MRHPLACYESVMAHILKHRFLYSYILIEARNGNPKKNLGQHGSSNATGSDF